ncbi:GreA/GreB family elongation factor [uncultured Mesonia sp.]|uniref:GreA/GreB family elongation factor n=1 Tax=uncultured Mesonia sp. TaxID=399731 RepID=UPI00374F2FFE
MSRGFVKEEDQEEPPFIPPRAALPIGVVNYVTPKGFDLLQLEKNELEEQRKNLDKVNETEYRRNAAVIDGKMKLLNERLRSAKIIDLKQQPKDEVRFGAQVKFLLEDKTQYLQIVGVDEANLKEQKIAFIAPLARVLNGLKAGESSEFSLGNKTKKVQILAIKYAK